MRRLCRTKDISGMHFEPQMTKGNNDDNDEGDIVCIAGTVYRIYMLGIVLRIYIICTNSFIPMEVRYYYFHLTSQMTFVIGSGSCLHV